jgi:hypothetical protein
MLTTVATLSTDLSPYTRIPVTFRRPDGSVGFSNTAFVGQLGWSGMSGAAAAAGVPASFKSFCIDGLQFVSAGRATTFPTFSPAIATAPLGGAPAIGVSRASLLESFWRQYGPASAAGFADKTDAAAFQVAVWEIINDATAIGTRLAADLTGGQFSVGAAGRTLPAYQRAQQWLAGFDAAAPARSSVVLYTLQSPTSQDQIVAVPTVDLDVDSDNTGSVSRSAGEEGMEEESGRPGVLVPVGGDRVPMVVEVPAGQVAAIQIMQGADRVAIWTAAANGQRILSQQAPSNVITASTTLWIEGLAPSAGLADVAFKLSVSGGPGLAASSDIVRASTVAVDLDVDTNNDGLIDPDNGPAGTDDPVEEALSGRILFMNTDDDNLNGTADVLDVGLVAGENDLAEIVVAAAPPVGSGVGSLVVTYDETIVRLYKHRDRREGIVSGSSVAGQSTLYAEGRMAGTSLVTVTFAVNAVQFTDTVRVSVQPYPVTIDVDIDSDNNNDFVAPARSEWEDTLEDHDYGIGKLIMLDNDNRSVTPIVMEIAAGLPADSPAVGVRIDWDVTGPAGWVRLWNTSVADALRKPGAVHDGQSGNFIAPGFVCKLSDLNYNPSTGTITIWAEGIRENEQLKTLAGVEAAPRVDERIRGTLVVNGDDAAYDEVKYIVANEDSFYYALHKRQEVRNALASRGVYSFADLQKFSLQPKSPKTLGMGNDETIPLGADVPGFKAMVYQDYITGEDQYVLAFGGTDPGELADWYNDFVQGFGFGAPEQYVAAMAIGDALASQSDIPARHLVATGHSLGGGLASAAAVAGGMHADTFNAAWLRRETLMTTDGQGQQRERYADSLSRFAAADEWIDAWFIDYDAITAAQGFYSRADEGLAPVGAVQERDGPRDIDMALGIVAVGQCVASGNVVGLSASLAYTLSVMTRLHLMDSVLYGLLVTEATITTSKVDMLGYSFSSL